MSKIIVANWKMNPQSLAEAEGLFNFSIAEAVKYPNIQTIICPPFVFIEELARRLLSVSYKPLTGLGSQDLFWETKGAFTGEISPGMLESFSVSHVLIGHSDRRYVIGESDEVINKKIKAALETGITPILLVGEREGEDREEVLTNQLTKNLENFSTDEISKILFCYEPVWAISTNPGAKPDTPENTLEAISFIDDFLTKNYQLSTKNYLYGGSVNEKNAVDYLKHPEIGGAVIGAASLRKEEFGRILNLVSQIK